ncbi:MAG: AsmA family protein [Acidobacteriota bacterium]
MSIVRKVLVAATAVLVLTIGIVAIVLVVFDADSRRDLILERISQALNCEVEAGGIELGLLPPRLRLKELRVAEAEGFEGEEFFTARAIEFQLDLWSLLRGKPVVSALELDQPRVFLRQDEKGEWNVTRFGRRSAGPVEPEAEEVTPQPAPEARLKNWVLSEGVLVIEKAGKERFQLTGVDLRLNEISAAQAFPFSLEASLNEGHLSAQGWVGPLHLDAPADTPIDAEIVIENLGPGAFNSLLPEALAADTSVAEIRGRLKVAPPASGSTGAEVSGRFHLKDAVIQPVGWTEPVRVSSVDAEFGHSQLAFTDLRLNLAGGNFQGSIRMGAAGKEGVSFDLRGDRLDVALLPSLRGGRRETSRVKPGGVRKSTRFPDFTARGRVRIERVVNGALTLAPFESQVRLRGGTLICEPIQLGLYGGTAKGRLEIDSSKGGPVTRFGGQLTGVDVNALLSANSKSKNLLFGNLDGNIEIIAVGAERESVLQSAKGKGAFRLVQGRLAQLNLGKRLGTLGRVAGLRSDSKETPIEEMSATFRVERGWVRTEDFKLKTPELTMTAKGGVSFKDQLDLEATAVLASQKKRPASPGGILAGALGLLGDSQGRLVIPFNVKGRFAQPEVTLDAARLARRRLFGSGRRPNR